MKNIFILFYLIHFATSLLAQVPGTKKDSRPNILFIMSDDHTSQAWGIYGGVLKDVVKNTNIKINNKKTISTVSFLMAC